MLCFRSRRDGATSLHLVVIYSMCSHHCSTYAIMRIAALNHAGRFALTHPWTWKCCNCPTTSQPSSCVLLDPLAGDSRRGAGPLPAPRRNAAAQLRRARGGVGGDGSCSRRRHKVSPVAAARVPPRARLWPFVACSLPPREPAARRLRLAKVVGATRLPFLDLICLCSTSSAAAALHLRLRAAASTSGPDAPSPGPDGAAGRPRCPLPFSLS